MKSFILTIFIGFIFYCSSNAQNIKTYSGNYDGTNTTGKATYMYYENAQEERIYQGSFNYSALVNNVKVSVTGNFKEDKRNGLWQTTVNLLKPAGTRVGMTETAIINYSDGKLNGKATYSRTLKDQWSGGIATTTSTVNANFSNSLYSGSISSLHNNSGIMTNSIKGQFDNDGYMNGKWVLQYHNDRTSFDAMKNSPILNDNREYKNGVLYKITIKNSSTGEIIDKADYSELTDKFNANFDTLFNVAFIDNKVYRYIDITNGGHVGTEYGNSLLTELLTWWDVGTNQETFIYEISKAAESPETITERIISEYKTEQIYNDIDYLIEQQDFDNAYIKTVTVYRTNPQAIETYIRNTYIFLFTGKEIRAEKGCNLGLEQVKIQNGTQNQELLLQCNLAHSYLLQGKYEDARAIYIKYKNEKVDNVLFKDKVLKDFSDFEKFGIKNPNFDRIRNELK